MLYLILLIVNVIFSFIVAEIARERSIGYVPALVLSLIASPIIGIIIVLISPKNHKATTPKTTTSHSTDTDAINSMKATILTEQLQTLKAKRDNKEITQMEYEMERYKLLNSQ